MPPFRTGPIEVDRKFDGDALKELRDIGHGHHINIVDASYDIPRGAKVVKFPGTSAEAFLGVVQLIPIEGEDIGHPAVTMMSPDNSLRQELEDDPGHIAGQSREAFFQAGEELNQRQVGTYVDTGQSLDRTDWTHMNARARYDIDELEGFYTVANSPDREHVFIRTVDELPFACISLIAGHSQRTK